MPMADSKKLFFELLFDLIVYNLRHTKTRTFSRSQGYERRRRGLCDTTQYLLGSLYRIWIVVFESSVFFWICLEIMWSLVRSLWHLSQWKTRFEIKISWKHTLSLIFGCERSMTLSRKYKQLLCWHHSLIATKIQSIGSNKQPKWKKEWRYSLLLLWESPKMMLKYPLIHP